MIKNFICFAAVLLCFFLNNAYAQLNINSPKDFTIHSPNVTSLGQYNSYPVDLSTGVPQINIPLYTITSGKLSFPISLSYHAGGIKVDQQSSLVGLAWTLNAGGVVTRTLKDKIDENSTGFQFTGQSLPDFNSIYNVNGAGGTTNSVALKYQFEQKDNEPDIFNLIAPGLNDEFCFDNTGHLVGTRLDSLKYNIDFIQNLITVIDRSGNTYRFGRGVDNSEAFENTSSYSQTVSSTSAVPSPVFTFLPYVSGWYLTEMISADGADTVSFKYKSRFYNDERVVNTVRFILHGSMILSTTDQRGNNYDGIMHNIMNSTIDKSRVIDKIIFKGGSLEFTTASDRLDERGGSGGSNGPGLRVTGFNVYNSNHQLIKGVQFDNNSYFDRSAVSTSISGGSTNNIDPIRKKSMKLNGVKFFDKNNIFSNEYKFSYDDTPLPPRNTTSQDFWGFYNGKGNSTLIPKTFYYDNQGRPEYYGSDRKTDFNFSKAAILKQIKFPTGGSTNYEYEPNYYLSEHASQGQVEVPRSTYVYAINRQASCRPNYMPDVPMNNSVDFQVTNLGNSVANLYVMFSDFAVSQGLGMTFDLWEINSAGSLVSLVQHYERLPSSNTQPLVYNQSLTVYEGRRYRMIAKTNGVTGSKVSMCNSPYIEAGITYTALESSGPSSLSVEQAGGLRVKAIINYNNDNTVASKKTFEYGSGVYGVSGVGVGKLITDPSHNFYNFPVLYYDLPNNASLVNVLWFTSNSQVELGMNGGCPVDYDKVTVKDISFDLNTNGKTEYYYKSVDGYHEPKSSSMYPYDFIVRPFWTTNNLIKTIYFKGTAEGNYIPTKRVENGFDMVEKRIKTLKIFEFQPDIYACGENNCLDKNPNRLYHYNYFQARGKALKTSETTTDYENNGTDSLVTTKLYQYNPYYDLKQEMYTDNRSRTVQTNYKYTGDINYTNLIAKNAVSLPIQTEQVVAGKVRHGRIIKYNDLTQLTDEYNAQSNSTPVGYTANASVPAYYERAKVYDYDAEHKNVKTVTSEGSLPVVYIWSYNGQYPVAEIKGVTYSAIESALGGATAVSNFRRSMPTNVQVTAFLASLRNSQNAQVTTYIYDPLIGMTSMTDAKGMTIYYEYDDSQRLKNIKDQNGNIIKHTDYHYQGQ